MGFSPIGVGDASPTHWTFTTDSGVFALTGISASAIAMHYIEQPPSGSPARVGTGTWTITNAGSGLADYYPSSADVATPGTYKIYPVITLSTGPKPFDPQILEILNLA